LKTSKEIKTAILVLSGIFLFIFIFNYLKGENLFNSSKKIAAIYSNVEGLSISSLVTINGHKVGKVQDINFTGDGSGKLKVSMLIDSDFNFSKNSIAELYESGLIGGKAIAIIPVYDDSESSVSGDVLISRIKPGLTELVNQRLTPLQEKIESVMVSADALLVNVNSVFDKKTKSEIKGSISKLEQTISSFEKTSNSLQNLIESNKNSINNSLQNFSNISDNLSDMSETFSEVEFKQTVNGLKSSIESFNNLITNVNRGEGSMGKLFKDEKLYNNLESSLGQLESLLEDLKLNPKRYVHFSLFGKKNKPYQNTDLNK
tara:strand:+ start:300 stop:1250 length:951 start_codon:yes stop_codon:yes gene_type:complete